MGSTLVDLHVAAGNLHRRLPLIGSPSLHAILRQFDFVLDVRQISRQRLSNRRIHDTEWNELQNKKNICVVRFMCSKGRAFLISLYNIEEKPIQYNG